MIENLLEIRKRIKDKKPDFIRQDNDRRMRIGRKAKWRKPKGIHSKIRHHFKGRRKMPSPGFKSPTKVRGLHDSGLKIVGILSADGIKGIKKESEGIIIAKSIGMKKRLEILKKAKELQIQVLNLNVDEQIKKIEERLNLKKKTDVKAAKTSKEQKDTSKEREETPALTDEQRKILEKKEKDKILTKKA